MNPSRLISFAEAYVEGLRQAVTDDRNRYHLQHDDTPDSYALRVALTMADLIQRRGLNWVLVTGNGFRNACKTLGIDHSEKAINKYLEAI